MKVNENNKNAYIGKNVESLFNNSVVDHPSVIESIRKYFRIEGRFTQIISSGIHMEKADSRMEFACGHNIDVNIKAYKAGFNQLTRTSVKKFCEKFDICNEKYTELEKLVINKSISPSINLFPDNLQNEWKTFFANNVDKILLWGFSHKPSREILALYDRINSIMRIYPMKDVLKNISKDIKFTKGGINIGDCVSFQRKGGNGSLSKDISKTDIKHPGNDLQLKIKINKFVPSMEKILLSEYII